MTKQVFYLKTKKILVQFLLFNLQLRGRLPECVSPRKGRTLSLHSTFERQCAKTALGKEPPPPNPISPHYESSPGLGSETGAEKMSRAHGGQERAHLRRTRGAGNPAYSSGKTEARAS